MRDVLTADLSKLDMNAGFLCYSVHWRPNPNAPNPDVPGQKLSMVSYIPVKPRSICLCGSGNTYNSCCQPKRYWHPVCPNPGMQSYSLLASQSATFDHVNGAALRQRFQEDTRLYCVDDRMKSSFWIFWDDPAVEDQYGILCFGDLELKQNRTLLVTAMSDLRMQMLLNIVQQAAGDTLGAPRITRAKVRVIEKAANISSFLRGHEIPVKREEADGTYFL